MCVFLIKRSEYERFQSSTTSSAGFGGFSPSAAGSAAFAFTADVDATSTKLALADEWFDVTDAGDIVLALTPSDVLAAEKRD